MASPISRFSNIAISGLAHCDADVVVTSTEIESQIAPTMERLNVPLGLLEGLTGIVTRRFWKEGVVPSDAAALAAEKVLDNSPVDRDDIGAVINTSVCRDYLEHQPQRSCRARSVSARPVSTSTLAVRALASCKVPRSLHR